jgi:hypothetical protein
MCPYCNRQIDFDEPDWGWSDNELGTFPWHFECFQMSEDYEECNEVENRQLMINELSRLLNG